MPKSAACNINRQKGNIARECVCAHVDQEFCGVPGCGISTAVTLTASEEEQARSQNTASAAAALARWQLEVKLLPVLFFCEVPPPDFSN